MEEPRERGRGALADTDDAYAANIARIKAALRSRHPARIELVRRFLSEWASERGERAYANHLETISAVLFGDHSQFGVVRDYAVLCISRHQSRMEYEVSCPMVAAFG